MTNNRGRGRPPGTGINDMPMLMQMADLMARNPKLKPTAAIRRIDARAGDAQIRRLQVKWKLDGAGLLSQARARSHEAAELSLRAQRKEIEAIFNHQVGAAAEVFSRYSNAGRVLTGIDIAAKQALNGMHGDGVARALRELIDSGAFRSSGTIGNHSALRAISEAEVGKWEQLSKQLKEADSAGKAAEKALKSSGKWPFP